MDKSYVKAMKKAEAELTKVSQKALDNIYYSTCICLHKYHEWDSDSIENLVEKAGEVFNECANLPLSLVQMCHEEVGIEFQSVKQESYKDMLYLNSDIYEQFRPTLFKMQSKNQMAWQVRVKQKMQDWAFPQVMASVTLAIFRTSDMEFDEIAQLVGEIEQTIYDFNENSKLLQQECLNETGILFGHSLHGELALIVKQEVEV